MWEVVLIVGGAAGLSAGFLKSLVQSRRRLRTWQDAAGACGLQDIEAAGWSSFSGGSLQLKAFAEAEEVKIETCGKLGQSTRIVVAVPWRPAFYKVSIRRESPVVRRTRDIEIGDSSFDSTFFIEGPLRQVLALLDAKTRSLLLTMNVEDCLEITRGNLRAETSDKNLPDLLPRVLDFRRRFTRHVDIVQRLAENARHDPVAGVRLRNLLVLVREFPGKPGTLEALRAACSDSSLQVQLQAAMALGAEGRDLLIELAESLVDDAVSAKAVSILDRELPFERTKALLHHALDRRRLRTARACLEALGQSGDAAAVDALAKVMALEKGNLALAAALALGATGSPAAEPPLIEALERDQASLRVAAATALGRVGSADAVLPLKQAAEGSWLDRELRQAAGQAMAEIQSRLQGASPGQLSLAATEAGQLSLAQDEAGQLSLAQAEAGQLSLSPKQPGQLSIDDEKEG